MVTSSSIPLGGLTVELLANNGKIATTTTNGLGYHVFRFSQPGSYTVKAILPSGYTCPASAVSISISQFQTLTVNFVLTKS
ncbi:MAG: carboxypeptidase regulatory-like domain-containing protein [Nitrososphaerales archaeon]